MQPKRKEDGDWCLEIGRSNGDKRRSFNVAMTKRLGTKRLESHETFPYSKGNLSKQE
ncbi:hypothetical protein LZY01_01850 [Levilactobacillus zymae]|uniref:Uncharacterized protein n=1 Tax=Levilactobacillus zymae TaxID=267363 RepID=A0ABQ0WWS6_9LACO|nr:hypothetical protein LZY01_01850 [Levilactobacillus zymae]